MIPAIYTPTHAAPVTLNIIPTQADSDAQLLALWLADRPGSTTAEYERRIGRFLTFCPKSLHQVTYGDILAYKATLSHYRPATVNAYLTAVKSLFSFAERLGYLKFNPGAPVRSEAVVDTLNERILTTRQVSDMIAHEPNPRNRIMLRFMYRSAVRVSELAALTWAKVREVDGGVIITVFGKGGKTRHIRIGADVAADLMELRPDGVEDTAPVFRSRQARRDGSVHLARGQVLNIVRAAAKRAAKAEPKHWRNGEAGHVSPHFMRHAHASHSLDGGAPVHLVQATLGHSSLATTSRYVHVRPDVAADKYLT